MYYSFVPLLNHLRHFQTHTQYLIEEHFDDLALVSLEILSDELNILFCHLIVL
jgi:hypothetical protein